jgi:TRAP transporter 4TM/12TM fusion protein
MRRELTGVWKWIARVASIAFTVFHLYTGGFGILPDMQQRAIHVFFGFILTLFLFSTAKREHPESKVPIWDLFLAILTTACCINTYIKFEWFHLHIGESTTLDLFLGVAIVILALETGRRVVGWVFPILTILFLLYTFLGPYFPGKFRHPGFDVEYVIQTLNQTTLGVWGFVTGISATLLAMFIIFSTFLLFTGGGQSFIDIALRVAGRFRGGPALVAVVASGFFGTISGSAVANVVGTGSFTIPLMKRLGYKPEFAGGVEATASSGGQIMPPIMGAGAFIMAELLGIPYLKVASAATIPACLFYISVFSAVRFEAMRMNLQPVPNEEILSWNQILTWGRLAPLLFPVFALIGLLVRGYTPTTSGFWASVLALVLFLFSDFSLTLIKQRGKVIVNGFERAGTALVEIVSLLVCANIMISLINLTGIGVKLSELIISAAGTSLLLSLVFGAIVALILGMGMPTTGAYLIAASVISTPLIKLGLLPLGAHLFLFYFAVISAITPPVCVAVYAASGIAKANWLKVAAVALRLALIAYFIPFIYAYEPKLILVGKPTEIIWATITASVGAVILGAAMMGYLRNKLSMPCRILLVPSALMLVVPGWKTDFIGVLAIALILIGEKFIPIILVKKKSKSLKSKGFL